MKKSIISSILLLFAFGLLSSCSQKFYESLHWQNDKVTIDGKIPEWSDPLRFYDDKSKINYTISNDRENLYLCMKTSYEPTIVKIIHNGMDFRIDTIGKESFPISFNFPIADEIVMMRSKRTEIPKEDNQHQRSDNQVRNQKMLSHARNFHLTGFKAPLNGTMPLINNRAGISAAINIDSLGFLYYEAIIPLGTFYKKELTGTDTNKVFCYDIKIAGLPAPETHEGVGTPHASMGGAGASGGRHQGSGMGGGHYGGGGGHHGGTGGAGTHENNSGHSGGNSDLYGLNQITRKLKFAFK